MPNAMSPACRGFTSTECTSADPDLGFYWSQPMGEANWVTYILHSSGSGTGFPFSSALNPGTMGPLDFSLISELLHTEHSTII